MREWRTELALVAVLVAVSLLSARRFAALEFVGEETALPSVDELREQPASIATGDASVLADAIVGSNPFRLSNRPSNVPLGEVSPPVQTTVRPQLRLLAIAGGPPWTALIAGLPGTTRAAVVTRGQVIDALRVIHISRDTVCMVGLDTSWTLVLQSRMP